MAFLTFRGNTTSPTKPTSTRAANSALTNSQIDGNFASLNDSKLEKSDISADNVASKVVTRDLAGSFSAGTITANLNGIAATAIKLNTAVTLTIGASSKSFDGSTNLTWSDADISPSILDTNANGQYYLGMSSSTSGRLSSVYISSPSLYFNPSSGTLSSTTFSSLSDSRFKKDLIQIEDALFKVRQLSGYTYTLVDSNRRSAGLIAQEVELVQPESVGGNSEKKTLDYNSMMGLVVEAIKELDDKLESIKSLMEK